MTARLSRDVLVVRRELRGLVKHVDDPESLSRLRRLIGLWPREWAAVSAGLHESVVNRVLPKPPRRGTGLFR